MLTTRATRREFLGRSLRAAAGVTLGAPVLLGGCAGALLPGRPVPSQPSAAPATVAAARGKDLRAMVRDALDTLGGLGTVVRPGETVFIKPNLLTAGLGRAHPAVTGEIAKPELISAVAEECLKVGAAHVTIGDGTQVERFDWHELRTLDGDASLASEAERLNSDYGDRVTLACLNADSPEWDPLPARRTNLGEVYVSSLVARADRIISIPVLKTHRLARLSLSIKNFMGTTPIARYGGGSEPIGRFRIHAAVGGPEACALDIVDALRPDLAIIDASVGCEGYGPWVRPNEGRTVDLRDRLGDWLILASTDLVAADATAARIVGHDPMEIRIAREGHEQGLGQAQRDLITIAGGTLDELRVEWAPI